MKNLSSLYRTMKLRYVPYPPDGTGRDRYVAYNNGGFFDKNKTSFNANQNNKQTGTSFDTKIDYKYTISPSVKAPNFHYHGDGTGRDSYIISNGGGLFYDSRSLNSYKLTDFLRKSETGFMKTNNFGNRALSLSEMKYNMALRDLEKSLVNRLYEKEIYKRKLKNLKKEEEEENENFKYSTNYVLPQVPNKRSCTETNFKDFAESGQNEGLSKQENEGNQNTLNNRSRFNFNKTYTISNDHLMRNLERLTKYDANKKYKRQNQNFNQAYFHLRNVNYNTISV